MPSRLIGWSRLSALRPRLSRPYALYFILAQPHRGDTMAFARIVGFLSSELEICFLNILLHEDVFT